MLKMLANQSSAYTDLAKYSSHIIHDEKNNVFVDLAEAVAKKICESKFDTKRRSIKMNNDVETLQMVIAETGQVIEEFAADENMDVYEDNIFWNHFENSEHEGLEFFDSVLSKTSSLCAEKAYQLAKENKQQTFPAVTGKKVTAYDGYEEGVIAMFSPGLRLA